MATAVDNAIVEVQASLDALAPQHEGLRDFLKLNIDESVRPDVQAELDLYDKRVNLLNGALQAMRALVGDGYPAIPVREVTGTGFTSLQDQLTTITAALAKFTSDAGSLNLKGGTVQPK